MTAGGGGDVVLRPAVAERLVTYPVNGGPWPLLAARMDATGAALLLPYGTVSAGRYPFPVWTVRSVLPGRYVLLHGVRDDGGCVVEEHDRGGWVLGVPAGPVTSLLAPGAAVVAAGLPVCLDDDDWDVLHGVRGAGVWVAGHPDAPERLRSFDALSR